MSLIASILSKFDDSGIKKAQHGFNGLKKTLGAIGIGMGLKQVADVLMDAAKAASADAKSTKLMNIQLTKNAGATKESLKQNDKFIESLSLQTGILDDDLRPSLSKFANTTGSVKQAQKLLKITLDATAGSGKSQTKIANAVAKAYAGNTKALQGMFPELKKSKDVLGDFAKEFDGLAKANADPFMRFNNSMDILKEKLGNAVLPLISDFVDEISKPGGMIEVVGKFLDDLSNPKTEAGKMFLDIKDAVAQTFQGVKDFFALFGNGDAMKGFGNIASSLVKALPALLALKGILMLASATTTIANLAKAIGLIALKNKGGGDTPLVISSIATTVAAVLGISVGALLAMIASIVAILGMSGDTQQQTDKQKASRKQYVKELEQTTKDIAARGKVIQNSTGLQLLQNAPSVDGNALFANPGVKPKITNNNVTINVTSADPKAVVDALGKYVKNNGTLPTNLFPVAKKP